MRVVLPGLFSAQHEVATDPTRFRVLAASRRWGKTHLAAWCCLAEALRGGNVWWVAPTYSIGALAWEQLEHMCANVPQAEVRNAERAIIFRLGRPTGRIQIKSADNETSLLGAGLDFCVIEEAAYIKDSVWYHRLRPTLSDRRGRALFISTPNGKNYFYDLWLRGVDVEGRQRDPDWRSWLLTCNETPILSAEEIEAARRELPANVFAREYMCSFADSGQGIFTNIERVLTATVQQRAIPEHSYVAGIDIARYHDYTVIATIDETTLEVVHIDRFTGIQFQGQIQRILDNYAAFGHRRILIETNSYGQSVYEELRQHNLPVNPFVTSLHSKQIIIERLAAAIDNNRLSLPNMPELVAEFLAFEAQPTIKGMSTMYRAARGHDDIVIAVSLAYAATLPSTPTTTYVDLSLFRTNEYAS